MKNESGLLFVAFLSVLLLLIVPAFAEPGLSATAPEGDVWVNNGDYDVHFTIPDNITILELTCSSVDEHSGATLYIPYPQNYMDNEWIINGNGSYSYRRQYTVSGKHVIKCRVSYTQLSWTTETEDQFVWTDLEELCSFDVKSKGKMPAPQVSLPERIALGETLTIVMPEDDPDADYWVNVRYLGKWLYTYTVGDPYLKSGQQVEISGENFTKDGYCSVNIYSKKSCWEGNQNNVIVLVGNTEQTHGDGQQQPQQTDPTAPTNPADPTTPTIKGLKYKLDSKKKTAALTGVENPNASSLTIPATISVDGKKYKVSEIKPGACKDMKNLSKVTIGVNIIKIGKGAFDGCEGLKTINIKTKNLTSKTIGAKAFRTGNKKTTVKCPKGLKEKYASFLVKKGLDKKTRFK